ncbi:MAG: bifunctional (p)ppGpp synthetase/guanosine-3',5'-bis(diphosphate) 3'-pyrophosphohydrolase [Clostridiales bacterium]|nr:bifunctional (p)ppGpp synthetase/guanosine-3',5'-bis(diphosphate) 3'-pyrophosphohydrolase [Clostridiales bacterium]MDY5529505.1 bifunctional (p)ppGpp synthetase/guanosine-3',5'-bis(diphosphate) 3'-pyrophosphohydrolase [Eubacteriales bacterium]MDD7167619.1 bifunctional (p)ppGpp synthetase/guanosine-3',5'-bis(diphosphate) 3'-pyrophosphohydrolase [Clostridiales bacterium]MDD7481842.1 bifunctional (p)ppGpp synthetase/guanosine-3',5'-bis(diphosphate) 3'-pyrophosphohydrolase [Clostridiales bacteriu
MDELLQKLKKNFSEAEFQELKAAYDFSAAAHEGQKRQTGEPYFIHPCAVVNVLVDLGFDDVSTLVAAFLHDVLEDTQVTADELEQKFGKEVLELVEGVTKLDKIKFVSAEDEQAENLRKMFFAMAKDYRVIIIKLADRLHNMRTLDALKPEKQIKIATQSLKIYAPLAGRLGLSFVKCELEDLAMRYLYPDDYYELVEFIKTKSKERQQFIEKICDELKAKLQELGIEGEVNGRQKHLYGIYKKMLKQGKNIEQIYDISAVRVIVNEVQDCYTVLGAIHTMWMPLPGRFKDYIAMPKPNGYQSLHTTVITKFKETFEIQIRTYEMHRIAEYGIAAHWKYKEGKTGATKIDDQINWLREVMDTQRESSDSHEFLENIEGNVFTDEVYVFTPKGKVLNLPVGSTTVDFAYAIHSAVGNKCIGAKVNGKIVPLNTVLNTGDIVEILTTNSGKGPSRDWIKFVKTASARTKIRQYFKKEMKEENIKRGKDMLEREAKRRGYNLSELLSTAGLNYIMNRYTLSSIDDLYASVGFGGLTTNQIIVKLIDYFKRDLLSKNPVAEIKTTSTTGKSSSGNGVLIRGYDDFLVRLSHCCNPVPGDKIVGYVSRGRGVSVHCVDCPNVKNMEPERLIEAKWDDVISQNFLASLKIYCENKGGILAAVTTIISNMKISITGAFARSDNDNGTAEITVMLEVKSTDQVEDVIKKLKTLPEVIDVHR